MLAGWVVVAAALFYIVLLFLVATYGDRASRRKSRSNPGFAQRFSARPTLYALSLAVYCTSWTFFGSVGLAARTGWDFIGIYTGPILVFTVGYPLVRHIVAVSKTQRITSVADFISARYGKSQTVAMVATLIAVVGSVPYIALQLKAVSTSLAATVLRTESGQAADLSLPIIGDVALLVAIAMALFAVLFGTRHSDATEHQEGLMLAVATESVVKLIAFVSVGVFVLTVLYDGPADLFQSAADAGGILPLYDGSLNWGQLAIFTLLSSFAVLLLPRQFHVTVVENNNASELKRAVWLFPLYLLAINLFVVPIAIAGRLTLGPDVSGDLFVVALPLSTQSVGFVIIAFIGGLSAATAMVIVAAVALSIMISNQIVLPVLLRRSPEQFAGRDMTQTVLVVRRVAIFFVLALGYLYYELAGDSAALASIGLLSFAAIAQLAPAFLGGLFWRGATARGAVAAMVMGFAVWFYTLLLPSFAQSSGALAALMTEGLFQLSWLRPEHLFGSDLPPLTHGVLWSLTANVFGYVALSLTREPLPLERLQADSFVHNNLPNTGTLLPQRKSWRGNVTVEELQQTISRYLGSERTERAFKAYAKDNRVDLTPYILADSALISHSEQLLASAIGAASSRLVFSLLMQKTDAKGRVPIELLDDASQAIQYNRDLLQSALDHVWQGIAVFDINLRLICWNQHFRGFLNLPTEFGQVGTSLGDVVRFGVENGHYGTGNPATMIDSRLKQLVEAPSIFEETFHPTGQILEVRTNRMPDGGIVVTYTDVSERAANKRTLEEVNHALEERVKVRTEELTRLNAQLEHASQMAHEANVGKTKFLAAAGHDILQPLNAARLYTTALGELLTDDDHLKSAHNIEAALGSVEDILSALLDISRLDAGATTTEITVVSLDDLLEKLQVEFSPMAKAKDLTFHVIKSRLHVRSDRRLLRRLLQNLISNAIKYTPHGRVTVGCRRHDQTTTLHIYDTGIGIPLSKQKEIFGEFQRLESGMKESPGLGLGLSIVERLSDILKHPISLESRIGMGTRFSVTMPVAQAIALPQTEASKPSGPLARLEGTLILCIDNEVQILDGMRILLEGWGCRVLIASNQDEATQVIEAERKRSGDLPDVILVDYHLDGEIRGVEVLARLRWRFKSGLPAVLITADRTAFVRDEAGRKDMPILNKPLKPAALRSLLQQLARTGHHKTKAPAAE